MPRRCSGPLPVEDDLARTLREISARLAAAPAPSAATLQAVAGLLEAFAARQRQSLGFDAFPLPADAGAALCSYDLTEPGTTPVLRANALNGGSASGIHDHGTWAVIVAVQGRECNHIYRPAAGGTLEPAREAWVEPGAPLVLQPHEFHRIHTAAPALQLHLYGRDPELLARRVWDPATGRLLPLGPATP